MKFNVGDRVRINDQVKYPAWIGLTGVVTRVHGLERGRVVMRSDTPIPNWGADFLSLESHKYDLLKEAEVSNSQSQSQELEDYKKLVLEQAIKAKEYVDENEEWCEEGFKNTLDILGLKLPEKRYAPDDNFKGGTIFFNTRATYFFFKNEQDGKWYKEFWYGSRAHTGEQYDTLEEAFKDASEYSGSAAYHKDSVPISNGYVNSNWGG